MEQIEMLGRKHAIVLPDFACREELATAFADAYRRKGVTLLRAYSAILGLCTRIGRESGVDYAAHRFDALQYGGAVYGWLREKKVKPTEIEAAVRAILPLLTESLAPREEEVVAKLGESEAGEGR